MAYDKAEWHTDTPDGPPRTASDASRHIVSALRFLETRGWLTQEGVDAAKRGRCASAAITESMLTHRGQKVIEIGYKDYLRGNPSYSGVPDISPLERAAKKVARISESKMLMENASLSFSGPEPAAEPPESGPARKNVYLREQPLSRA